MDNDTDTPPFQTAAEAHGMTSAADAHAEGVFHQGKSFTPGLVEVPGSKVPGTERSHVHGPQQAPCDPIAAGLATERSPLTVNENRVISQTGEIGSGPRAGGVAVSDGTEVRAAPDAQAPITPPAPIETDED